MSKRLLKIAETIQLVLSEILEKQVQDPRLELVSFTHCDVSADLRHATLYFVAIKGSAENTQRGLESAKSLLRRELGKKLKLKFTPELEFKLDKTIEKSLRIEQLLSKIKKEEQ